MCPRQLGGGGGEGGDEDEDEDEEEVKGFKPENVYHTVCMLIFQSTLISVGCVYIYQNILLIIYDSMREITELLLLNYTN